MNLCTSALAYVCSIGLYKRIANAITQSIRIANAITQSIRIANADGQENFNLYKPIR